MRRALIALALALAAASARAEPLRFCLDENGAAASRDEARADRAFDVGVAQAVAARLGRAPVIVWRRTDLDNDSHPDAESAALLSDGRCDLVAGYPLFAGAVVKPESKRARLPGFEGAKPEDRRRWVNLKATRASRGYRYSASLVVLATPARRPEVKTLADLKGLRLAIDGGTLGDAILMSYGGGVLIPSVTHLDRGQDVFAALESGAYDATLVDLPRFDAYLARHPGARLASSGHYHSVGFNFGFVGLAENAALMESVDAAVATLAESGELSALARAHGVTYLPPREPNLRPAVTGAELARD